MEYTEELTLIAQTPIKDSIGQITFTETSNVILAKKNVVGTKEFYSALGIGLKPNAELQIKKSNYNNEQEVEYEGIRYQVIRTIPKGKFDIVLVIGIKDGVN